MASKYNKNMSHDELVSALNAVKARKDQMESQSMDSIKQDLKGWTKEHKDLTAQAKDLESKLKDDQVDKPQQKEPKISEPKVAKVADETKTEPKVAKVAENDEATFDNKRYKHLQTMDKLGTLSPKQEKELRELDKQYREIETAKQEARVELREKFKSIRENFEAEQKTSSFFNPSLETKTENTVADKIGDGVKTTANFAGNVIKNSLPFGLGKLFDDDTAKTQEAQNEKEKEAQREEKANNVLDKLGLGAVATTGVELLSKMKESVTNDDKAKAEVAQQAIQQQENTEQMKMVMR